MAWQLGLDRDGNQANRWKGHGYIINIDGAKFYDFATLAQKGGGGAIDLVMHVNDCDFKKAIAWLHDRFGESGVMRAAIARTKEEVITPGSLTFFEVREIVKNQKNLGIVMVLAISRNSPEIITPLSKLYFYAIA